MFNRKEILLHHDSVRSHAALEKNCRRLEIISHVTHSFDLACSGYHLVSHSENLLIGNKFKNEEQIIQVLVQFFLSRWIYKSRLRWQEVVFCFITKEKRTFRLKRFFCLTISSLVFVDLSSCRLISHFPVYALSSVFSCLFIPCSVQLRIFCGFFFCYSFNFRSLDFMADPARYSIIYFCCTFFQIFGICFEYFVNNVIEVLFCQQRNWVFTKCTLLSLWSRKSHTFFIAFICLLAFLYRLLDCWSSCSKASQFFRFYFTIFIFDSYVLILSTWYTNWVHESYSTIVLGVDLYLLMNDWNYEIWHPTHTFD